MSKIISKMHPISVELVKKYDEEEVRRLIYCIILHLQDPDEKDFLVSSYQKILDELIMLDFMDYGKSQAEFDRYNNI